MGSIGSFQRARVLRDALPVPPSLLVFAIGLLLIFTYLVVYKTGGTKYAYVHVAYLPIVLGAWFGGLIGGLVTALLGGVILGPFMPMDVAAGSAQALDNWLTRAFFFVAVGALAGLLAEAFGRHLLGERRRLGVDYLLGVPTPKALIKSWRETRDGGADPALPVYAVAIDANCYNDVALTLGAELGNEAIKTAYRVINSRVIQETALARLHRDLFVGLIDRRDLGDPVTAANEWLSAFPPVIRVGPFDFPFEPLIGIAELSAHDISDEHAYRRAWMAIMGARSSGHRISVFDHVHERRAVANLQLLAELKLATDQNQIEAEYQPLLSLESGRIRGVEALARWRHPRLGLVSPGTFVPLAESSQCIHPITQAIVDLSLARGEAWNKAGLDISVAINLSPKNLSQDGFVDRIEESVARHGADPSKLTFEITESSIIHQLEPVLAGIERLRSLGCKIALDDFGTGYSSMSLLYDLPVDYLKIDQTLVRDIPNDARASKLVVGIIHLAHELGLEVVAEGVESEAALAFLRQAGCDMIQGYLVSPPVAADKVDRLVAAYREPVAYAGEGLEPLSVERTAAGTVRAKALAPATAHDRGEGSARAAHRRSNAQKWRARRDSNSRPPDS